MKTLKTISAIVLFVVLFLIITVMFFCIRGEWSISGYQYSDGVKDVIRMFSLFEIVVSIALGLLNRRKWTIAVIIAANLFTLYKFVGTF